MKQFNDDFFQSEQPITRLQGDSLAKMVSLLMPDAAVFTVDKDRKISYWSRGAEKLLGFTEQQLKGEICLSGNRCPQCMSGCGLLEAGKVEGLPLVLHTASGDSQPVIKYAMAYSREDGSFDGGLEVLMPHHDVAKINLIDSNQFSKYGLISQATEMEKVFQLINRVSNTEIPVLIRGESGTGKELVARAIHGESARKNAPFIAVNCATLTEGLLESELFGHVKGAFTGAVREHAGVFERAKGGTLFLDEVAELPFDMQAKLLRVLETGDFIPVGAEKPMKADVRILTATHKALREEVKHGRFRMDLLYRLRVIPIFLPNLSTRKSDIPLLIKHILKEQFTETLIPSVSRDALTCLMSYEWPGNIRELKNSIHYALVMCDGKSIELSDLPPEIAQKNIALHSTKERNRKYKYNEEYIITEIKSCNGNLTLAAEKLGIGRTTLWRYRNKMKLKE
jgi:DNA-binding NtrC family response regulator